MRELMDTQFVFNFIIAVAGFLGVFVFNQIMQRLTKIESEIADFNKSLPTDYVHKDDYRSDMGEVKGMLKQIYDKLDAKADK